MLDRSMLSRLHINNDNDDNDNDNDDDDDDTCWYQVLAVRGKESTYTGRIFSVAVTDELAPFTANFSSAAS